MMLMPIGNKGVIKQEGGVMHRRRRYWVQGGIDCLYDAENVAIDLFKRARDYEVFLCLLSICKVYFDFRIIAYCLMPNCYHLIVEKENNPIIKAVKWLNHTYLCHFGKKKESGIAFETCIYEMPQHDDNLMLCASRYIHMRPVLGGLVRRTIDYKYSSYNTLSGSIDDGITDTSIILDRFFGNSDYYADFVNDACGTVEMENMVFKTNCIIRGKINSL